MSETERPEDPDTQLGGFDSPQPDPALEAGAATVAADLGLDHGTQIVLEKLMAVERAQTDLQARLDSLPPSTSEPMSAENIAWRDEPMPAKEIDPETEARYAAERAREEELNKVRNETMLYLLSSINSTLSDTQLTANDKMHCVNMLAGAFKGIRGY